MTQRIKELLDDAVAGVEPADPDPVAAVLRRGRAERRRNALVGGLAALVVAAITVPVVARAVPRATQQTGAVRVTDRPALPEVRDGQVIAGDLALPIPPGWRALVGTPAMPCEMLTNTILYHRGGDGGCVRAPVEVMHSTDVIPPLLAVNPVDGEAETNLGSLISGPPTVTTIDGGAPAWLMEPIPATATTGEQYNPVVLPWSKVYITLRVGGAQARDILRSITSNPVRPGPLRLPASADSAELTVPDPRGRADAVGHRRTSDPATVAAVLDLLRNQDDVVANEDACASLDQKTARLELKKQKQLTEIVLTLGDRCQEAVSSSGGRVRLDDAAVAALQRTMGITA